MIDLTDLKQIRKLDPKDVYGSTGMLASQCEQIWEDAKKVVFPDDYKKIKNIIICGMGGSAYGGHVLLSAYKDEINIPVTVSSNYVLPKFVDRDTLVVLTSYSGSTEETLSCAKEAQERNAKITGVTNGGKLADFLDKKYPSLIFNPRFNPSGQPRLGTGYIVLGSIALLAKLGIIQASDNDAGNAINFLIKSQKKIEEEARRLAKKIKNKMPVIFGAEFLEGNTHIMRNQFNETAKSFSAFSEIPELNHHLMEGLKNPKDKELIVFFITSDLYSSIIKKRVILTKDVVEKNNIQFIEYKAEGKDKLSQVLNVLSLGGYLTLYLALLYGQDPSVIPWVDYFKEKLKSS